MDVKEELNNVKNLANQVAKDANKQRKEYLDKLSLYKLIIICITFCFIVACGFMYMASVKKTEALKDLFYDMTVEDTTTTSQEITGNDGSTVNAINGNGNIGGK